MRLLRGMALCAAATAMGAVAHAATPFRVLALYGTQVEADHVAFARQAIHFYSDLAQKDGFTFTAATGFGSLNAQTLSQYQLVLWLDDMPADPLARKAFSDYMEHGGRWLGFHITSYTDEGTHWPWYVDFLGGAVFNTNSWPPMPATLQVDDASTTLTQGVPHEFVSPSNEWYIYKPSPREQANVKVFLSLKPSNYPLGWKDTLVGGDVPVVWTNTKYRMLYINMGHGDKIFTSYAQNRLFENALLWLRSHP